MCLARVVLARAGLLSVLVLVVGCATRLGTVPFAGVDADVVGVKLLRPGIETRVCRTSLLSLTIGPETPPLDAAIGQLLALDSEANVIVHAEVRERQFLTGVYNRRCFVVRGDLGRTVSTIVIPPRMNGR